MYRGYARDASTLWAFRVDLYGKNERMSRHLGTYDLLLGTQTLSMSRWALQVLFEHIEGHQMAHREAVTVTTSTCLDKNEYLTKADLCYSVCSIPADDMVVRDEKPEYEEDITVPACSSSGNSDRETRLLTFIFP